MRFREPQEVSRSLGAFWGRLGRKECRSVSVSLRGVSWGRKGISSAFRGYRGFLGVPVGVSGSVGRFHSVSMEPDFRCASGSIRAASEGF